MTIYRTWPLANALFVAGFISQPAVAQDTAAQAQAEDTGEIVVTAQRREESLQRTPVAVSAFTATMLEQRGVTKLENIAASTPGLNITPITASPNAIMISMRGALEQNGGTITAESPVAIYIDDVYQSRLSGANYDLADIVRVEVLRGPQGTLYGRNSMTGAIKLITRQPDGKTWLNTDVSYASFQETKAKVSVGGPVTDHIAVAASAFYNQRGKGWQYNEVLDKRVSTFKKYGVQLAVGLYDIPGVEAVLTGRYVAGLSDGQHYAPLDLTTGGNLAGGVYNTRTPRDDADGDNRQKSVSLRLGYDVGDITIRSITAYQEMKDNWALDFSGGYDSPFTGTTIAGFFRSSAGKQNQFTQEFQALGKAFDNRLNWIVGAFYYKEKASQSFLNDDLAAFFLTYEPSVFDTTSKSLAFYAQADYEIIDDLKVSVGIRHTNDKKTFDGLSPTAPGLGAPLAASLTGTKADVWTPKVNIQYNFTPDIMAYATVSRGYRAGGFNSLVIADPANFGSPYAPEFAWSYEFGLKAQTANRKAYLNIAAYHEQLSDLQTLTDCGNGCFTIQNAAKAKVQGIEWEGGLKPVTGLSLFVSGAYTFDKYQKLDPGSQAALNGATRLPMISRWQYQFGGSYEIGLGDAGSVMLAADYNYRGRFNTQVPLYTFSEVKAIDRGNASITYTTADKHLDIYLQATNVTNSKDYVSALVFIPGVFGTLYPAEPRIWRGGFRYKF
ncbi:TonB-dependent receptor [Sphingobium boeckii]|uniref:Iron complex outermembrane receptor protein n=1 Tax=Sphingobium boeckii TaxID=1082345 RepID=A0A7W9AKR3_9SPHN|nr:TonB-dependent receptor [Sphingobium boeckii]MBB5687219.1 iron complex outermembrane receptor protein [Sphingobium boeckii]